MAEMQTEVLGCNTVQKSIKIYLLRDNLSMMQKTIYNMEKIKSYPNTQLPEFTPVFQQIP
jgi:hypothetical protein